MAIVLSEVEVELDADAVAVGAGVVAVVEAPHVIHSQNRQDIVKPDTCFEIGLVTHGLAQHIAGEEKDVTIAACIHPLHRLAGVVLIAEAAPQAAQGQDLPQAQFLDERQTVHQHAVAPIGQVPGQCLVVDELQGLHQGVALGLDRVGKVDVGQQQVRVSHTAPHLLALDDDIGITEGREPETLLQPQGGLVDDRLGLEKPNVWCNYQVC